jgi:hypothetical protein
MNIIHANQWLIHGLTVYLIVLPAVKVNSYRIRFQSSTNIRFPGKEISRHLFISTQKI